MMFQKKHENSSMKLKKKLGNKYVLDLRLYSIVENFEYVTERSKEAAQCSSDVIQKSNDFF